MSKNVLASVIAIVITGVVACDPCTGVAGCSDPPKPSVEGRVLTTESGGAVSGATLRLTRVSGSTRDSVTATTDGSGLFSMAIDAPATPGDRLSLTVRSPDWPAYTIDSLPCPPPFRGGDGCVIEPIVEVPRLPVYRVLSRRDPTLGIGGARVTFRRKSGSSPVGKNALDSVVAVTTPDGFVQLFGPGVFASSLEPMIGDLVVDLPAPIGPSVRRDFAIRPIYTFKDRFGFIGAGPTLHYWLVFVDSVTNRRLAGAEVEFQRTGGITTVSEVAKGTSDENGITPFLPVPTLVGSVIGTLRVRPRATSPVIDLGVINAATFDADTAIVFAKWLVGVTGTLYPLPREGKP